MYRPNMRVPEMQEVMFRNVNTKAAIRPNPARDEGADSVISGHAAGARSGRPHTTAEEVSVMETCSRCGMVIGGVGRSPWWYLGLCVRCYLTLKK